MFNPENLLWLVPGFPLLGAILAMMFGGTPLRKLAWLPVIGCSAMSLFTVLALLNKVQKGGKPIQTAVTWFSSGNAHVDMGLFVDPLTAVFLFTITFVGSLIVIFSIGYMSHDRNSARFHATVSLFIAAMCLLVMGDNFVALFAGWEGVGVCSYMLVGFWYSKPSAAAAARKAFLVTRLGDVGMILGIALLWKLTGYTVNFLEVFDKVPEVAKEHPYQLGVACLLLLCGAVGKSAQFPLYVWLPDAMEGPTPVSALIHAATMVTAGVYLLARCAPIFALVPGVQVIVATLGGITAILAAFIAMTQHDLKRVLAYSTVSQLGYMFMALGCVGAVPAELAVVAAVFHVFTHAFFKAVLFLSAGSVMHAMGDVIDMRKFGGLRKLMPATHIAFLCGAAALAGLPLLSGFWSKDMILESLLDSTGSKYGTVYWLLFAIGIVTAGMTACYTFRAYFRTFHGPEKIPTEAGHHAHESPPVMTGPLFVLAFGAAFVGLLVQGFGGSLGHFLADSVSIVKADVGKDFHHHTNWALIVGSVIVAVGGVYIAWMIYGQGGTAKADVYARNWPGLYHASLNKLYVDEIYHLLIVSPGQMLAQACRGLESLLYDVVRLVATLPGYLGEVFRPMQNGLVQFYGLSMAMGLAAFVGYLILWAGK